LRIDSLAANSKLSLDEVELVDQVLERWEDLESQPRRRIAQSLLQRLDAAANPLMLADLSDEGLRELLRSLLAPATPVTHV